MLADVIDSLRCPVCTEPLALEGAVVTCGAHSFDVARKGYVNLLPGDARPGTADTPSMVAARAGVLARGHFEPLAAAIADLAEKTARDAGPAVAVEVGAGTGYYLATVLDRLPAFAGVALDVSKHAARAAARAHARIGAVVCDAWRPLPLADGCASLLLDVFAPRNAAEFARVLAPGGALIVVTPRPGHLAGIVGPLGLLGIEGEKERRVAEALAPHFGRASVTVVERTMRLTRDDARSLALMGPSAHHAKPGLLEQALAELPEPFEVSLAVDVALFRHGAEKSDAT